MNLTLMMISALFGLSFAANVFMWFFFRKKLQQKPSHHEVTQLIHDLTRGAALVKIERVAPEDVLLRSPRS